MAEGKGAKCGGKGVARRLFWRAGRMMAMRNVTRRLWYAIGMSPFFDAHVHLFDARLACVRDAFEAAAQRAGVTACVGCAAFPEEWSCAVSSRMAVTRALGVHPWVAEKGTPACLALLKQVLRDDESALVGEIGLDGLRPTADDGATQARVFEAQLTLAAALNRPVVLHGARAWQPLFAQLSPWVSRLPAVMVHGAAFSEEMLRLPLFRQGRLWVSIGGAVVNPKARRVRALAAAVPMERLLIETDAPDLFPVGGTHLPGETSDARLNHPGNLPLIAATLATLRGCSVQELAEQTFANAQALITSR